VAVDHPNCPRCGATGQITGPGGRPAECPQCRGTHRLRVLVYR
jgi:DnaJ-class molecular chaperone